MSWASWIRDLFTGFPEDGKHLIEVTGTPIPEGSELVSCSFCHCVVPTVAVYEHWQWHRKVMHVEESDE